MSQSRYVKAKSPVIEAKDLATPEGVAKKLREIQVESTKLIEEKVGKATEKRPCINASATAPTSTQEGGTIMVRQAAGNVPVQFPPPTGSQDFYVVRQASGATVTCATPGSMIQGQSSYTLPSGIGAYHFRSAGRAWWLVV